MENYDYIFFFKPNCSNGWMSNFFESPFTIDDVTFTTNEQFFMWSKCKMFEPNNGELEKKILLKKNPSDVKKLGRTIKNFDEVIWKKSRFEIMKKGLLEKFKQNDILKNKLIDTKSSILIEASPYDKIWGIGMDKKTALSYDRDSFNKILKERNLLGKGLMDIRSILTNTY